VEDIPISEARLKELKDGTVSNDNLHIPKSTVPEDWPSTLDEVKP